MWHSLLKTQKKICRPGIRPQPYKVYLVGLGTDPRPAALPKNSDAPPMNSFQASGFSPLVPVAAGKGRKGGMRPGRHCVGVGNWRVKNTEFYNLAATAELAFALQTVIFYTLLKP